MTAPDQPTVMMVYSVNPQATSATGHARPSTATTPTSTDSPAWTTRDAGAELSRVVDPVDGQGAVLGVGLRGLADAARKGDPSGIVEVLVMGQQRAFGAQQAVGLVDEGIRASVVELMPGISTPSGFSFKTFTSFLRSGADGCWTASPR
jgi:hypothetical protein